MVQIDKDVYLETSSAKDGKEAKSASTVGSTADFFTKQVVKNLSTVTSKADKSLVEGIIAKYEKEFGAQKNTFAASKQILKEINA